MATTLSHNLDPAQSAVGIADKALAGLVFAKVVGSEHLATQARALATHHGVDQNVIEAVDGYDPAGERPAEIDDRLGAILAMAHAFGPSPAQVSPEIVTEASNALKPDEIVELTVWISVSQLIHRLTVRRLARAAA
ncbi:MAG: hypothetical protein AAFO29_04030 [Actinomycetota bacterium]